jgi:hypothetical protein
MIDIENKIEDTLKSLDDIQRAVANPYLYTRIEQRLNNKRREASCPGRVMPVLAVALVLFIGLNVACYFRTTSGVTSDSQNRGASIENFANEYNLSEETGL